MNSKKNYIYRIISFFGFNSEEDDDDLTETFLYNEMEENTIKQSSPQEPVITLLLDNMDVNDIRTFYDNELEKTWIIRMKDRMFSCFKTLRLMCNGHDYTTIKLIDSDTNLST